MQRSYPASTQVAGLKGIAGWGVLALLGALLWVPTLGMLLRVWHSDASLSHGPLVPMGALVLLWLRRAEFKTSAPGDLRGLALLALSGLVCVGADWADVEFLQPVALVGMMLGGVWYLTGLQNFRTASGPLGFLAFMIPWPTTLVERLSFPLQLTSSAYAAMLAGLTGLNIQRNGVEVHVMPDHGTGPIYSILVAAQCSGLTSLLVLLALGYLVALFTRAHLGWRALLVASVVPVALAANALRLTFVLLAGAHHSAAFAHWIHDNESPVLVTLCSCVLLGIRHGILTLADRQQSEEGAAC